MTDERVAHVIVPEPHSKFGGKSDFIETGIKGGHQDEELKSFVANHPELGYRLEQVGPDKVVGGVTYRKYKQYLKTPEGEVLCEKLKSTTTNASKLIVDSEAVLSEWLKVNAKDFSATGRGKWDGVTAEGVPLRGNVALVNGRPEIQNIFVEEEWIQ